MSTLRAQSTLATTSPAQLRRWFGAVYVFAGASNLAFTGAVWVIYLATKGYDPVTIGLMETLFHVAKFAAEVPTGVFADLVGRRASLIAFCVLGAVAEFLLLAPAPPVIAISFALSGVSYAFRGGAEEALLWNLVGRGQSDAPEQMYSRIISLVMVIELGGQVIGTGCGGFLGNLLILAPFIAQGVARLLAIIPLALLPRETRSAHAAVHPLRHIWRGLQVARRDSVVLGLLLIGATVETTFQTIYYYHQLYLRQTGVTLEVIGIIFAASTASSAIFTALAPRVMRLLRRNQVVALCVITQLAGFALMSVPNTLVNGFGFIVAAQFGISLQFPALSAYLNARLPEAQRATVLSFQSGLFSCLMIALFPLFGVALDHAAFPLVYLATTALLALVTGSLFALLRRDTQGA